MPRLSPKLIHHLSKTNPLLPLLLRQTRTPSLAKAEYRWLLSYVLKTPIPTQSSKSSYLKYLCHRRSIGVPLQYLLKTQPFGNLEILCGPGALIPRPETEETVFRLCEIIELNYPNLLGKSQDRNGELRILDLCTGPGSIVLLAADLLHKLSLQNGYQILGVDISSAALALAKKSLNYNISQENIPKNVSQNIDFVEADILTNDRSELYNKISQLFEPKREGKVNRTVDIIISNPPYISPEGYWKDTARSVRLFEPELALVPPALHLQDSVAREDLFYPVIQAVARDLGAQAVVLETGGNEQSTRVREIFSANGWETSIWEDFSGIKRNVVAWQKHSKWSCLESPA
ncbi:hypothetical protein TWF694_007624 [Orbilia ellipsospora]|uniref:Type II methyltransferase M.TaqI-like domain-containing protein n=1 Tax=Orbilia ellipsospora TaxID=2528407 RepID=A0AAV9XJ96_9PEZI